MQMAYENGPQHDLSSWRDSASAWIVSAALIAGLVVAAALTDDARYTAASQGGLTAPVATGVTTTTVQTE